MEKIYSVFISSTHKDLKKSRANLQKMLLKNQYLTFAMENFTASSRPSLDLIESYLNITDFYVLIIAGMYGSIIDGDNISYTEKEFELAQNKNIPTLVFEYTGILDELHRETDETKLASLESFKKRARQSRNITFFDNFDDLNALVISTLNNEVKIVNRPGWIRGTIKKKYPEYVIVVNFNKSISQQEVEEVGHALFKLNSYLFPSDKTIAARPITKKISDKYITWKFIVQSESTLIADKRRQQFEDIAKEFRGFENTDWMEFRGFKYL